MSYKKLFDAEGEPAEPLDHEIPNPEAAKDVHGRYVFTRDIELAINVALVTGRTLLVRGRPGSGKSSLAAAVARRLGWAFYQYVITSRTEAEDLLWRFDAVRRLADAQAKGELQSLASYVEPGILWWAMDRPSARRRGVPDDEAEEVDPARDPAVGNATGREPGTVVLLDEIDKAQPDVPNNLLEVLGSRRFFVRETNAVVVASRSPLLIISTNEERSLPDAFLRRCVILRLLDADVERLVAVGRAHFDERLPEELLNAAAQRVIEDRDRALRRRAKPPSTAEYLDLLRACGELGVDSVEHELWQTLSDATLWKHGGDEADG